MYNNYYFSLFIHTKLKWARYDMRGTLIEKVNAPIDEEWEILCNILIIKYFILYLT